MAIIWVMAIAVPVVLIPGCYNSTLIKLFVFTLSAGLLLLVLGLKMIKDPSLPENLPIHLLLLIPAVTALHAFAPSNPGITRILLVSSAIGIFISIRALQIRKEKILLPVIVGGSLAILLSFLLPSSSHRLAGVFGNANLLGSFAAGLIPVGFALLSGKGWKKVLPLVLFLVICSTALIMSGTRSSILALVGSIVAVICLRWKPGFLNLFLFLFFAVVLLMVFLPQLPVPQVGGTPGVRQVIWEGSSKMFLEKPFFGWGNGSFQLLFPRFRPSDFLLRGVSTNTVHAHSEPLEILVETGVTGLVLWSALFIILLKQTLKDRKKTFLEWGIIASVFVLLLEGLTSVALRWTTSVFLLAVLMSLLPVKSQLKKLPRWTALLTISAGLLLIFPGAYKAYRMIRSSFFLNSAMTAVADSERVGTVCDLCRESLRYNSWELGSWYTLANIYGQQAAAVRDVDDTVDLIQEQLAAYDSLSARAEDFAWMRVNRIDALLKLGMFDRAMDDVIYLYRHRLDMKEFCLKTGYSIIPLSSPGKAFEFMNYVFADVLVENWETEILNGNRFRRTGRVESSMLTNFALAAVYSPEVVVSMKQVTDSILTQYSDSLAEKFMSSIERELLAAPEGYSAFERYNTGNPEGLEQECLEVISSGEVYGTYHRAVLCLSGAQNGSIDQAQMAYEYAIVLAEPCSPLVSWYPGAGELFIAAATASGELDQLEESLRWACEIDSYGSQVMRAFSSCLANRPPIYLMDFWYRNGGPQASTAFTSPTGILLPDGETRKLLQFHGSQSTEYRITAHFLLSCLSISSPGADSEYISTTAILRLQSQKSALAETYGLMEAGRIINSLLNKEIDYLENGPFDPAVALVAKSLKAAFETGEI